MSLHKVSTQGAMSAWGRGFGTRARFVLNTLYSAEEHARNDCLELRVRIFQWGEIVQTNQSQNQEVSVCT